MAGEYDDAIKLIVDYIIDNKITAIITVIDKSVYTSKQLTDNKVYVYDKGVEKQYDVDSEWEPVKKIKIKNKIFLEFFTFETNIDGIEDIIDSKFNKTYDHDIGYLYYYKTDELEQ